MIIYPSMLVDAAKQAGMKVPPDPDKFEQHEYPHFDIFCKVQLCRKIRWGEHWENAKVVAAIPDDKLERVTMQDLINAGLEYPL